MSCIYVNYVCVCVQDLDIELLFLDELPVILEGILQVYLIQP